jgi:hypothetical protein
MGDRQLAVLGVIAIAGLVGGAGLTALAVLTFVTAKGGGGDVMTLVTALGVAIGEFVLAAFVLVPAILLLRAVSILSKPVPMRTPPSLQSRVITGVAAAAVLFGWMAPAALTLRTESASSLDAAFSTIAIGIGLVGAATAFAARDLLIRPLGVVMLVMPLLSLSLPLWASGQMAAYQGRLADQAARLADQAAERAHFEERFAEILQGPTIEEVAAEVGDIDGWRLLGGGVTPMYRGDNHLDRQETLTDLAGSAVRFALVAQCTADFDGGELLGATTVFGRREANGDPQDSRSLESPVIPCDGQVHVDVSDAVVLPAWDAVTLAGAGRDWELVMTYVVIRADPSVAGERSESTYADYGARWIMFVTPEPAPPAQPLLTTLAAHLAPLRPR